jgi:hypothetical protein
MRSICVAVLLCTLHFSLSTFNSAASAAEPTPAAPAEIREAFEKGGPLISCWNVNTGWNLHQQVKWIEEGHHYMPCIWLPLLQQGANTERRVAEWFDEYGADLAKINALKLPVGVRTHNLGAGFYDAETRPPFEKSALVWRRLDDGSLDDRKLLDPLAPAEPWAAEGKAFITSLWARRLAEALPDVDRVYLFENNEAALGELGLYTEPTSERDPWRVRKRKWRPNLGAISVRMEAFSKMHSADDCELAVERGFIALHEAMWKEILANAPAAWKGKLYGGGYGGMGEFSTRGLDLPWSYERPQEDWSKHPWAPAIWEFTEPSDRCYDDGSGSPFNWHDWVRSPQLLQQNFGPVTRYLESTRPLWHEDRSVWISPQRSRVAKDEHGGYVLPERALGFYRAVQWSDKPEHSALVSRYFANSQELLTNRWFDAASDPPELAHLTHGDYFAQAMRAADEVWEFPILLDFWRRGAPVVNPDPPLCEWKLPASITLLGREHAIVDDRSRTLYSDADPPRFVAGVDLWRKLGGRLELKVFAQGWKIEREGEPPKHLIFAWSPRAPRENVTVDVPGLGPVLFDIVDPDGEFRILGGMLAIH